MIFRPWGEAADRSLGADIIAHQRTGPVALRAVKDRPEPQCSQQDEEKQKYGVFSLESLSEKGILPDGRADSPEEMVIRELCVEKLRSVIEDLTEADAYLLYLLFFEEVTVKEAAQLCGCSRKTIANRRKRILKELNEKLKAMGIMGGYF